MRVHFIAIGGAVMHNLALALQSKGARVTGSDDEIAEPSRSRLAAAGLLPPSPGWNPQRIDRDLDAVILGMHARADNPELVRAQSLGVPVFSFPEFMYEQTQDKLRVVVAGSHGKTTITSLVMHVLQTGGRSFDYLVGAQLEGFSTMVGLRQDSRLAVFEGDEYLTSALDPRPKFLLYRAGIALISGIAWDHVNVFPTWEVYRRQFEDFVRALDPESVLIFNGEDTEVRHLLEEVPGPRRRIEYGTLPYAIDEGIFRLEASEGLVPVSLLGRHNMQNLGAAKAICSELGISDGEFFQAVRSFRGAARRLTLLASSDNAAVYLDFAHSPSKVRATTRALKEAFPSRRLVACLELHTFSSLTASFLSQYRGSLDAADEALVYFDPRAVTHKGLAPLDPDAVRKAFDTPGLHVFDRLESLLGRLRETPWQERTLLLMSSGTFSGLDAAALARELLDSPE
ncbi:MAG: Mur ligase family protein [Acidobacteriota bacterium]